MRGWRNPRAAAADALYLRFVQGYAIHVARLDPDMFEGVEPSGEALRAALRAYASEMEEVQTRSAIGGCAKVNGAGVGARRRGCCQAKVRRSRRGLGWWWAAMAQGIGQGISGSGWFSSSIR